MLLLLLVNPINIRSIVNIRKKNRHNIIGCISDVNNDLSVLSSLAIKRNNILEKATP